LLKDLFLHVFPRVFGITLSNRLKIKSEENKYLYPGKELEIFAEATNWKSYFAHKLIPYISGRVLEVGAGIGQTTPYLANAKVSKWKSLEPDYNLFTKLVKRNPSKKNSLVSYQCGTLKDIDDEYDSIVYIDVLEHIEDDLNEINQCSRYLCSGGNIIVLSPAHKNLFSPFDTSVGHYRRYDKKMLQNLAGESLELKKVFYLDCFGLFLNIANRLLLKKSMPSSRQIQFWDGLVVPISKIFDPVFNFKLGKSVIGIFEKK
tara:strand:- start:188 stop:967 length:780 start_codon:yes stop_codon:yes gene_type:complete